MATQIAGLAMIRYVLKVEPLASATPESLVAAIDWGLPMQQALAAPNRASMSACTARISAGSRP